ncbi:MAG: beta-ketoacyl-ACP synthase II [Chloroflexota bacterium]
MERRVVVTGMGCISPLGNDVATTWGGLIEGRSGVGPITLFDPSRLNVRIAGEVKGFEPTLTLDRKEARRMDRFQQMAYAASVEAMHGARFEISQDIAERVGVLVGSGIGGITCLSDGFKVLFERGPNRISPFLITQMLIDLAPGLISILLGAKGPNFATVSACSTSANAIGEAAALIRRGQADAMIAGGSEAGIVEISLAAFGNMRALSSRNDEPERASRPWDADRDGFVLAEGAGMVVLEELEFARARSAPLLAELVGYGVTSDASHITEPSAGGEGAARAMRQALESAGLQPGDVDYLNAHGTSTPAGDRAESLAIKSVFGAHAGTLPVSSTKSMTGHLLGAAGALESIICIKAMQEGCVPPTINYESRDPDCDLDYVPNRARPAGVKVALNNSFGFGGHNVSLVFRQPQP